MSLYFIFAFSNSLSVPIFVVFDNCDLRLDHMLKSYVVVCFSCICWAKLYRYYIYVVFGFMVEIYVCGAGMEFLKHL